jgi:hypothetical protein
MKESVSADQHPTPKASTSSGRCRKAATRPTCSGTTGAEARCPRSAAPNRFCVGAAVTRAKLLGLAVEDEGMSTVEYAIGTIAAAAFGAILYTVVTGSSIVDALTGIIDRALATSV